MSDVAEARGLRFDLVALSRHFGAPIVPMVASQGKGLGELLDAVVHVSDSPPGGGFVRFDYGPDVERALGELEGKVSAEETARHVWPGVLAQPGGARWIALKLLEEDRDIAGRLAHTPLVADAGRAVDALTAGTGDRPAVLIADRRYGYISGACQETIRNTVEIRHTWSDRIDAVLTHPVVGLPIFLAVTYSIFKLTFSLGEPPMRGLETLFAWLSHAVVAHWTPRLPALLQSLLVDGVIGGVGGVIVFLPNILFLFLGIALLEHTGYMARAAFLMDRYMHRIGLHGKSFIPMLLGFGCTVPAVLATRTLDSRRDRLVTMLILPLMSCGARFPIYALLIPAFFPPAYYAAILTGIYLTGVLLAVAAAKFLASFVFRETTEGLVIELPPYRMPTVRNVLVYMWERSWLYFRKAGTIILGVSVALWLLSTFPVKPVGSESPAREEQRAEQLAYSAAGRIGKAIEPVLAPLGFDWKIGTALIGAVAAKEVFVAQLGIVHALDPASDGGATLRERLRAAYTPLAALAIILFVLIGTPCVATVAAVRSESGRWRWALLQFAGLTALAYVVTLVFYQAGRLILWIAAV
jgi:ferrous iron transport protein B